MDVGRDLRARSTGPAKNASSGGTRLTHPHYFYDARSLDLPQLSTPVLSARIAHFFPHFRRRTGTTLGMISKLLILFPLLHTIRSSPLTFANTGRYSDSTSSTSNTSANFPTVHTPPATTALWNVSSTATDVSAGATTTSASHPTHVERGISGELSDRVEIQLRPGAQTYNGRGTFFAPGLGACGTHAGRGDSIVALNSEQYGE